METDKLNDTEKKRKSDTQVAVVEMRELNHSSRPSISGENKTSGYIVTLMHFIKGNIGCGMLAMGEAFKIGGLYLTLCILLYVWLISLCNMHILTTISKKVQIRLQAKRAPTFGDTVENAFKMSDKWIFRSISNYIKKIVFYNILITQLGFGSVYILFISTSLQKLLHQYSYEINIQTVILFTMPLIMVGACLRRLRFIAPLSTVANVALITGVVTIMYYSCSGPSAKNVRYSYAKWSELPTMFGIIMFSFEGTGLVLPLFAEMDDDKKFTSCFGVLNFGMVAVMMLNVPLGMTGYSKWGEEVKSSLTLNLPLDHELTQFVILMMILGIACSYALQFYLAAVIVYNDLEKYYGPYNHPAVWDYSIRISLCLLTYLAASTVPHLDLFMSLVGSVTCVALTMIFPALSNLAFRTKDKSSFFSSVFDMITIFTAVIGSVTGIYANTTAIYEAFSQNHSNG